MKMGIIYIDIFSLNVVPLVAINGKPTKLVKIMAWHRTGDKPLSEQMITRLTYWGRIAHICVGKLTIIGSHYGLLSGGQQAIIWRNDGILLI